MSLFLKTSSSCLSSLIHTFFPSSLLYQRSHSQGFSFSSFNITFTFQKWSCSFTLALKCFFSFSTVSFCLSNRSLPFLIFCPAPILRLQWRVQNGAAVFSTGLIGLIFYLEQGLMLHYTYIDLQLLWKSRHWQQFKSFMYNFCFSGD